MLIGYRATINIDKPMAPGQKPSNGIAVGWRKLTRSLIEDKLAAIDDAVPAPDLSDLSANDPAVKAAKQAYDESFAKSYAEARKKNT